MDIKCPIENEYMKGVLQINGFSGPRPQVRSSRRVGSGQGARQMDCNVGIGCNEGQASRSGRGGWKRCKCRGG